MSKALVEAEKKIGFPPCVLRILASNPSIVVVGTYLLEKGIRTGSLDFYSVQDFKLIRSFPTKSAILDIQLWPDQPRLLVSAQSTGSVIVWKVQIKKNEGTADQPPFIIDVVSTEHVLFDTTTLVLSLSFAYSGGQTGKYISATLSTGELALLEVLQDGKVVVQSIYAAHSLEAWKSAFGGTGMLIDVVFSGGDDGVLNAFDIRQELTAPVWSNKRIHDAGVTAILPSNYNNTGWNISKSAEIWTGCYDDHIRSIDLRSVEMVQEYIVPKVDRKVDLGGGVWRLVPDGKGNRVLACCMYGGARVLDNAMNVEVSYEDNKSMVYGGDWAGQQVITSSFYDCQLVRWGESTDQEVP